MRLDIHDNRKIAAAPVLWQDNYVSLMPGESRTITTYITRPSLEDLPMELTVTGWNVDPQTIALDGKPSATSPGASP